MRAFQAVLSVHAAFPVATCEDLVASLCGMDRYQASDGIGRAAADPRDSYALAW